LQHQKSENKNQKTSQVGGLFDLMFVVVVISVVPPPTDAAVVDNTNTSCYMSQIQWVNNDVVQMDAAG